MEILDVVNEKDEVIGQATRDQCHADPTKIHRTTHFTLFDPKTGKVLLTKRALSKKTDPGKLCFLGEHILSGESYEEATTRGVQEELGFTPNSLTQKATNLFRQPTQTEIVKFFLVTWTGQEINYSQDEIISTCWVLPQELNAAIFDLSDMTKFWVKTVFQIN